MNYKRPSGLRPLDWAFDQHLVCDLAMLMLLVVMARRGNSSFHCFMSLATYCRETTMCEPTVRKAIKRLLAARLIAECVKKPVLGGKVRQFRLLVAGASFSASDPKLLAAANAKSCPQNLKPSESEKNQMRAISIAERKRSSEVRGAATTYGPALIGQILQMSLQVKRE